MKKSITLICTSLLVACTSSGMGTIEDIKTSLTPAVYETNKPASEFFYCVAEKIEIHGFTVNSRISPDNKSGQLYTHIDYLGKQVTSIFSLKAGRLEVRAAKAVWYGWKSEVFKIAKDCV